MSRYGAGLHGVRCEEGTHTNTLDYLYKAASRAARRKRQEQHMSEIVGTIASRAAPAQNKRDEGGRDEGGRQTCISFSKSGKCRFGDQCRYEHISKKVHHASKALGSSEQGGKQGDAVQGADGPSRASASSSSGTALARAGSVASICTRRQPVRL